MSEPKLDMLAVLTAAAQPDHQLIYEVIRGIPPENMPAVVWYLARFAVAMLDVDDERFSENVREAAISIQMDT